MKPQIFLHNYYEHSANFLVSSHAEKTKRSMMNTMILLAAEPAMETEMNLWDMILKGGWLMIPIFILSLIAVYIFCERFRLIRDASRPDPSLPGKIRECLLSRSLLQARALCRTEHTPAARMLDKGLQHLTLPPAELRALMENTANREIADMERGLTTLATCSGMAPMLGFLGTVIGMIQAFYDMALAGNNINITLLSRGIYTAMVTTVAGLVVGIIAHFAYNLLTARIDRVAGRLEATLGDFMETVYETQHENQKIL